MKEEKWMMMLSWMLYCMLWMDRWLRAKGGGECALTGKRRSGGGDLVTAFRMSGCVGTGTVPTKVTVRSSTQVFY